MKNPYKSGLQLANLPDHALQEFLGRQPWSVFRLPDWCRLKKARKPVPPHIQVIVARRKAKKRAEAAA